MMTNPMRKTIYRAVAGLLVAALFAGIAPPIGASEMVCKMDRPASVSAPEPGCGACGPTPEPETGPSLKAASCCRFKAPSEAQALPPLLTSSLQTLSGLDVQVIALTTASGFPEVAPTSSARPTACALASSSSLTRSSILRL